MLKFLKGVWGKLFSKSFPQELLVQKNCSKKFCSKKILLKNNYTKGIKL